MQKLNISFSEGLLHFSPGAFSNGWAFAVLTFAIQKGGDWAN